MTMVENATLEKEREWFPAFLAVLRNTANVRAACEKAKIDRRTAYRNRDENESFRERWDEAVEDACDQLEAMAWLRAKGRSDVLLIFLLKAHRPEKYRERAAMELTGKDGAPLFPDFEAALQKTYDNSGPTIEPEPA